MEPMDTLRGRLLIATPLIAEPPFRRSVVFVLDHDAEGALGVIINRPLPSGVDDVLPDWGSVVNLPACLFDGGPVAMDSALGVGVLRGEGEPLGWRPMIGRVGLVDLDVPPPAVAAALEGLRVFAGYAGWSSGQLEGEIDEGAWIVVDSTGDDVLSAAPDELWRAVLSRQGGELRLLASYPDDPNDN